MRFPVSIIETVITWLERIERVPGGKAMLIVAFGVATGLWAFLSRLYWVEIFVLALATMAFALVISTLAPTLRLKFELPVLLQVDGITTHIKNTVQFTLFIHNKSKRTISLVVDHLTEYSEPTPAAIWDFDLVLDGGTTSLGPDEHTIGRCGIECGKWSPHDPELHRHRHIVRVRDRISGRMKRAEISSWISP